MNREGVPSAVLDPIYKSMGKEGLAVRVCSYHGREAVKAAEDWAKPLPVTHGICTECSAQLRKQIVGSE